MWNEKFNNSPLRLRKFEWKNLFIGMHESEDGNKVKNVLKLSNGKFVVVEISGELEKLSRRISLQLLLLLVKVFHVILIDGSLSARVLK